MSLEFGASRRSWLPRSADSMCSEFPAPACAWETGLGPHVTFSGRLSLAVLFQSYPGPQHFLCHALLYFPPRRFSPRYTVMLCIPSFQTELRAGGWFHFVHGSTSPAPRAVPGTRLSAGGVWVSPSHAPRRKITAMCPGRFLLPNPALASPVHRL